MKLTKSKHSGDTICPVTHTAKIVSGNGHGYHPRSGVKRFNQLERFLHGISPNTLSKQLHPLEEEGSSCDKRSLKSSHVEYSLTEKGFDLVYAIDGMRTLVSAISAMG
jgi:DNA-binding HxlR family transcriptional regulator